MKKEEGKIYCIFNQKKATANKKLKNHLKYI